MRSSFVCLTSVILSVCGLAKADLNDGLVAYYPFNGDATDESQNGNDGTVNGATLTLDRFGEVGSAYNFDGDDFVTIPDNINLEYEAGSSMSVSAWIKISDFSSIGAIYSNYRCVNTHITLSVTPDGKTGVFTTRDPDDVAIDLTVDLNESSPDRWAHLTGVQDYASERVSLYINGTLVATEADPRSGGFSQPGALGQHWIGAAGSCNNRLVPQWHFNGDIDDIRIYNRALTAEEVSSLYALESQNIQFQIIEGNFTWQEAKADAEAKGGRLAVLDTQEKIDAANAYLEELGEWPHLWIGLTDEAEEDVWKWIDDTPLIAQNWESGEPNNLFTGGAPENYVVISNSSRSRNKKWNDLPPEAGLDFAGNPTGAYLLEIIPQNPAPPLVQLGALYESPSGEAVVIDATPTAGFPAEFTYQWCFNGFKIPANLGGTASSINIDNLQANEGTWSVTVTNETGSVEQSFEYRIYADTDSDGLSDAFEELISETNINNSDTDNDGLVDGDEVNTYRTNPNSSDSDSDGFTDLYELETAYDPNSAESVPDAQVNIMTAIEVDFNAALGATYEIQFSTDTIEWTVIEAGIVGEGNAVERLYSRKDFPTGFFRVERIDQ